MGHVLQGQGLPHDPNKVSAIKVLDSTTNVKGLRSFLHMITCLTSFMSNLAELTEPFRVLTVKHAISTWLEKHQQLLELLKDHFLSHTTLTYFTPNAPKRIVTDASLNGLGAVIVQCCCNHCAHGEDCPISFASLSPVEGHYSQIECNSISILR